jgi:tetratricopeptide (TPR) repeat protein
VAVAQIIRTCNLFAALSLLTVTPAFASKDESRDVDRYFSARLAEIGNKNDIAVKGYAELLRNRADSEAVADRLFTTAIRQGDMVSALRAVRVQELRNQASAEAPLLLFADAFKRKNWTMANVAASELAAKGNFGFLAAIMKSGVNVAQNKPANLPMPNPDIDPYFAYFSLDQRVYLDLATGALPQAKDKLFGLSTIDDDFARDLIIRAAPIYAAAGDRVTAATLLQSKVERDYGAEIVKTTSKSPLAKLHPEEALAALYVRMGRTLLEQKNGEKALVFARVAQWLSPETSSVKLLLVQVLNDQGLNAAAISVVKTVEPSSPYWPRAVSAHVRLLLADKQQIAAVKLAKSASLSLPNSANLKLVAAQAYEETGDLKSASVCYQGLVNEADHARAGPQQRAVYRLFLGTIQDKAGDWPAARKTLEQARSIDPKNPFVLNYLGYTLLEKREDVNLGLQYVREAYALSPESNAIADSLGWGYFLTGDYVRAVPLLETAAKASGNDLAINEHLGDAYWLSGRFIEARYAWGIAAQTAAQSDSIRLITKIDVGLDHNVKVN